MLGNDYPSARKSCNTNLALKGKGRFINRPTSTGGKKYDKHFIYVPTDVAIDSQFPFKTGDPVLIEVDTRRKRVIVQLAKS